MEVKLIDGKWKAVFEGDTDFYFNINDVQKKLFGVCISVEFILHKHSLNKPKQVEQSFFNKLFRV